jgi:hypothetical protein
MVVYLSNKDQSLTKYDIYIYIDPRDGIFTYTDPITNDILLESVEDGKTEVFVQAADLVSVCFQHQYNSNISTENR